MCMTLPFLIEANWTIVEHTSQNCSCIDIQISTHVYLHLYTRVRQMFQWCFSAHTWAICDSNHLHNPVFFAFPTNVASFTHFSHGTVIFQRVFYFASKTCNVIILHIFIFKPGVISKQCFITHVIIVTSWTDKMNVNFGYFHITHIVEIIGA